MSHQCHHPTCTLEVPPKMLACKRHWFALPKELQNAIWDNYVPGQEKRKDPTKEYLEVMAKCIEFWNSVV